MKLRTTIVVLLAAAPFAAPVVLRGTPQPPLQAQFRTSDRCVACHNGLQTSSGEDVSIGVLWRTSVMANSSRDPYWQGSVRRESLDHPEAQAHIEDECSTCHMPLTHFAAHGAGRDARVFVHLPLGAAREGNAEAADGVSCSMCHQIEGTRLGAPESFNGNVVVALPGDQALRPEFGPYEIEPGHQQIMQTSTGGFIPEEAAHIRSSALCGSCHTLQTRAIGPHGEDVGSLPEQMPYVEWQHSDYVTKQTCQECHMPEVTEPVPVTSVFGDKRPGMHRHEFVGGNFLLQDMLNAHRTDLATAAPAAEFTVAAERTRSFLRTQSARVTIAGVERSARGIAVAVHVENLTGHKLPTAYPSRRAWLHVVVRDQAGRVVFESGKLNADGSIVGNDNDADPHRFEPHYREITDPGQVEIFEPILKDSDGKVTTGLLSAVGYLKDNRLLPHGFDKHTADPRIAVVGGAADDPDFTGDGSTVRYAIDTGGASGPLKVEAELWYQPVGFRWAHNFEPYKATEPQRFLGYYQTASTRSAVMLAHAEASR